MLNIEMKWDYTKETKEKINTNSIKLDNLDPADLKENSLVWLEGSPDQVKGTEQISYEDEEQHKKLPGKPGEVHSKYPWMVRNEEGKWPEGSIPYNEELKAGLYSNSISFEQAKNEKDLNDSKVKNLVKKEVKENAWDKYDKHPDLFKKIPDEKYKNVTDYFDRYYSSDFTKEKLKAYFPELSGAQLEQKVNEVLNKAREDIHRKKFYIVSRERMNEAEKVEPLVSYFSGGYAAGLSLGEVVIFSPDIQEILLVENISHEINHHVGLVEEDGSKKDFLDTAAKKKIQFKYTPIPLLGKDLPYPLSIRSYVINMPGEMKPFLDELRARYNLDINRKVTKEDIQKKGIINNAKWRQLKEAYSEEDLINMLNEIAENQDTGKSLKPNKEIKKPEENIT